MVRAAGGAGGASGTGGGGGGAAAATPTTVADSGSSEDEPATVSWREPATVPPQWSKAITKAFATMAALSRDDAPQWKFNFESEGVRCSVGRGDKPAARGDGIVPLPPRALFETITDFSRKREIDPQYEDGRVVEEVRRCATTPLRCCVTARPLTRNGFVFAFVLPLPCASRS